MAGCWIARQKSLAIDAWDHGNRIRPRSPHGHFVAASRGITTKFASHFAMYHVQGKRGSWGESNNSHYAMQRKKLFSRSSRRRKRVSRNLHLETLEDRRVLNAMPLAVHDAGYSTPLDTALTVGSSSSILNNDWDPEGSPLTASVVANPSNGSLSNFSGSAGTFTYTPNQGFTGVETFTYKAHDGTKDSNVVTVSIAVGGHFGPRTNLEEATRSGLLMAGGTTLGAALTPGLDLLYNSLTVPKPIVVLETFLMSSSSVPDEIQARLTFNGTAGTTYSYSTTGLAAGDTLRFALQADATALATGRYAYTVRLTARFGSNYVERDYSGYAEVVNRGQSTHEFGRGWQLVGLDELVSITGGMLLARSSGDALWFADDGSGGYKRAAGDRFQHRGQAEVAAAAQDPVGRANDQSGRGFGKRAVSQADAVQLAMDKLAHEIIVQPLGHHRIGHAALQVEVHRQVQTGQQFHLSDQDQVVVLGEVFQQQPQPAKVFHVHQVGVVDDRHQHSAGVIETECLLDQSPFALEGRAFERDSKRFAEDFDRVGVGVQGSRDGGHQMLFFREPFERFLDHRLAGAGPADDQAETSLLAVDSQRVVNFLLSGQQLDVAQRERVFGQAEIGTDHACVPREREWMR
jgi:hypothetical protein